MHVGHACSVGAYQALFGSIVLVSKAQHTNLGDANPTKKLFSTHYSMVVLLLISLALQQKLIMLLLLQSKGQHQQQLLNDLLWCGRLSGKHGILSRCTKS